MPAYQPRMATKFTDTAESVTFTFPLAEYSIEQEQPLYTPSASQAGAHGRYDMLVSGAAVKDAGRVRLAWTVFEDDPRDVEAVIDEQQSELWKIGRGKLWTRGLNSGGSEELRWTYARLVDEMPTLSWEGGMVLSKRVSLAFETAPFWYAESVLASVAAQGTINVSVNPTVGDTITIGSKVFTFVASGDANADGEIGIAATAILTGANIIAAINGSDGFNTAHTQVTAEVGNSINQQVVTAIQAGSVGNAIAFTETFTSGSNTMDGSGFLGGTTAGSGTPFLGQSSFTITNPGNAPIYDSVWTLASCSYTNPTITNTTTGHRLKQARTGTETLVFDAGALRVTFAGIDDYANFDRASGQVGLMRIDPGVNNFTVSGIASGNIALSAYAAYH